MQLETCWNLVQNFRRVRRIRCIYKVLDVLQRWTNLFGDAEYHHDKQTSQTSPTGKSLRWRKYLPNERIYNHQLKTLLEGEFESACSETFIPVRDLVVSRLTLFKARRGAGPSRLLTRDWQDAKEGNRIDRQRSRCVESSDESTFLMDTFKVIYQGGKWSSHLVPVLVPPDCVQALNYLEDPNIRKESGVSEQNQFLYPSTRSSSPRSR